MPGVPWHTQILADQLTLFQPGGTNYAHLITTGTLRFSDLPTALVYTSLLRYLILIPNGWILQFTGDWHCNQKKMCEGDYSKFCQYLMGTSPHVPLRSVGPGLIKDCDLPVILTYSIGVPENVDDQTQLNSPFD